jgi:hypothetical protein
MSSQRLVRALIVVVLAGLAVVPQAFAQTSVPSVTLNGYENVTTRVFTPENASLFGTIGSFGSPWGPPQPDLFVSVFPNDGSGLWQITLVPPVGTPLVPGIYSGAGGFDTQPAHPSLVTLHSGGVFCTGGTFTISTLDPSNPAGPTFDVNWTQDCSGVPTSGRAVFGAALGTTPPEGNHDGFDGIRLLGDCRAEGWAADPDQPFTDVTVRILADGVEVARVTAGLFREDLLAAGKGGDGTAAFSVNLDGLVSSDVDHEIRVEARDLETGAWTDLSNPPHHITCTGLLGNDDTVGGVADRRSCVARGWAFDADTPSGPRVQVRVSVDGKPVAETTANLLRTDVREAGFGDGYSGWEVDLFGRITPGRPHVVTAEMRDTSDKRIWLPVGNSGKTMTCIAGR